MESIANSWDEMTELYAEDVPFSYTPETGIVVTNDDQEEGAE